MSTPKMKYRLWLAWDDGETPSLVMGDSKPYFDNCTPVEHIDQVSIEQLVTMLDEALENANRHDFVGMAGTLNNIINFASDASVAKTVLWMVACRGGFDELAD